MSWEGKGLGWRRDRPDFRDQAFQLPSMFEGVTLPPVIDLRSNMPGIYDQGSIGSCTGNAIAAAIEYVIRRQHLREFVPSRLFIYYNERVIENSVASDAGAEIRNGIKSVVAQGVCPESPYPTETIWPYDVHKMYDKPPQGCYDTARRGLVKGYARVNQNVLALEQCLHAGFPIIFGFSVYSSFMTEAMARTGMMPMPRLTEKNEGGHAVLMVGYDRTTRTFIVRNSWGPKWGIKGYFMMPYDLAANDNLACDFWTIRAV